VPDHVFTLHLAVRDYECDYEGIVNNAVYLNYLEHTRHEYLKQCGLDVVGLAHQGLNLVVIRIEIDYLWPLRSGDQFWVGLNLERVSRLRFAFVQEIYHHPDDKPILKARVIGTAVNARTGRPQLPKDIEALLEKAARVNRPAAN
jgi:acyl-CoA thioester hydrolase